MKKAILYSALAVTTLGLSSCGDSFLEIDPVGAVSESTLMTEEGIDYVLTGAYSSLNNMTQSHWMGAASLSNYVFGDIVGADANKGSQSTDQSDLTALETYSFTNSNSYIEGKWAAVYEAVKRCNNVLSMANSMGETLADKDVIEAQAKFLKGVWMFEGIRMFGAYIPYVTMEDYEASTDPQVTNHSEGSSVADIAIWSNVVSDLQDAINGLPATWGSGEYGRATSWMAKAVLAKLYLYWSSPYNGTNYQADHWSDAKSLLDDIIANGVDAKGQKYILTEDYETLFTAGTDNDWCGEGVFDVQLAIDGTETDTNTVSYGYAIGQPGASGLGGWGFYQPTYHFVNSYIVDEDGLPDPDYASKAALTQMVNGTIESDLDTPVDPRLDHAAGRFYVPFLDYSIPNQSNYTGYVRDYTNGGLYMNKKNLPFISDRGSTSVSTTVASSSKNYHIIRYADILLMRAEVAIHENDLSTALTYINQVRARAANSAMLTSDHTYESLYAAAGIEVPTGYTLDDQVNGKTVTNTVANYRIGLYDSFSSATEATTALVRERRAEFGMEGHHWFDICRWGTVGEDLNAFRAYELQYLSKYSAQYNEDWVCMPIPLTTIQTAEGRIVQGPNWQ